MNKKELENFKKRYDKFRKNNLPTPFWDDERFTLEYVYKDDSDFNDDKLKINYSLTESLGDIASTGFYYPFQSKLLKIFVEDDKKIEKEVIGHCHEHSFEDVVSQLYRYPESFNILKEDKEFYSKQELDYLRRIKKYLLFIGLKDLDRVRSRVSRYRNKKHEKYKNSFIHQYSDNMIDNILKNNFLISKWYPEYKQRNYKKGEFQVLIADKDDNFKMFVEFIKNEEKQYKDIKDMYKIKNLNDKDKIVITYLKVLEKFQGDI